MRLRKQRSTFLGPAKIDHLCIRKSLGVMISKSPRSSAKQSLPQTKLPRLTLPPSLSDLCNLGRLTIARSSTTHHTQLAACGTKGLSLPRIVKAILAQRLSTWFIGRFNLAPQFQLVDIAVKAAAAIFLPPAASAHGPRRSLEHFRVLTMRCATNFIIQLPLPPLQSARTI